MTSVTSDRSSSCCGSSNARFFTACVNVNVKLVYVHSTYLMISRCVVIHRSMSTSFLDKFWEIRQMIDAWGANMNMAFATGYMNCLDESMSVWTNKFTCPGFMFVPRKPWPFGNEYHMVCCCRCDIMWGIELVEGKDESRAEHRRSARIQQSIGHGLLHHPPLKKFEQTNRQRKEQISPE